VYGAAGAGKPFFVFFLFIISAVPRCRGFFVLVVGGTRISELTAHHVGFLWDPWTLFFVFGTEEGFETGGTGHVSYPYNFIFDTLFTIAPGSR